MITHPKPARLLLWAGIGLGVFAAVQAVRRLESARAKQRHSSASMTILRPAGELYDAWKDPAQLAATFGGHFSIHPVGEHRTRWTLKAHPRVSWHCDLVEERPGEFLRWHGGVDSPISMDLCVTLEPAPSDRGTAVRLTLALESHSLFAPAKLLQPLLKPGAFEVLRRFKALIEAGEVPTISKNPTARSGPTANLI